MADDSPAQASTADLFCPGCGYNLRGIESERCPECGLIADRQSLSKWVLPWPGRAWIGRWRAFWRTVNLVTFRPSALAVEMTRPTQFFDAILFRRIVVSSLLIPAGITATAIYFSFIVRPYGDMRDLWIATDWLGSILQLFGVVVIWVCLALFLLTATAIPGYFFRPPTLTTVQQNRAVALSYYSCAPLVYTVGTCGWACLIFALFASRDLTSPLQWAFVLIVAPAPVLIELYVASRVPVAILKATTPCGVARRIALACVLPPAWMVLALIFLWVVPAAYVTLALMILSLRA
jgi:hypothetical protein